MRHKTLSIAWQGQDFHFERLESEAWSTRQTAEWAVWRRGEFIGTMPCITEVTTREFELRCTRWLGELLAPGAPI
jgi:hypothetical protein